MPHLLVDISAHGFGHVAQTAPVVNALTRRMPSLRVTLRTAAPLFNLRQRFHCDFVHIPAAFDFGMTMRNAVDVMAQESATCYLQFHSDWENRVQCEAQAIRDLSPDLLFANVPYLSLAAAQLAKVPTVAMCSLNWADVYQHYCLQETNNPRIYEQMLAAYMSAECFLQPAPSMPMLSIHNTRRIGPVADVGCDCRMEVMRKLGLPAAEKIVLVSMGGMEFRLPMENWPRIGGVHWLIPAAWNIKRDDMVEFESLGLKFADLLASVDTVLTKPGYGTFVEASCVGVPILYVSRGDWPEEPYLVHWSKDNNACMEVDRTLLEKGDLKWALEQLWSLPRPQPAIPTGVHEAADYLQNLIVQTKI